MNEDKTRSNDAARSPGEAEGDGRARHGYRNEVSWNGGRGRQPYGNQEEPIGPAAAPEAEGGSRGDASGRTIEQMEDVARKPQRPQGEAPRET